MSRLPCYNRLGAFFGVVEEIESQYLGRILYSADSVMNRMYSNADEMCKLILLGPHF